MKTEIKVPVMGESVSEASVSAILKESGSVVAVDEEILELETDKVNQVLYAPVKGTLTLKVEMDQTVKIGEIVGYVDSDGAGAEAAPKKEKKTKKTATAEKPKKVVKEATPAAPAAPATPAPAAGGGARVSREAFLAKLGEPPAKATALPMPPAPTVAPAAAPAKPEQQAPIDPPEYAVKAQPPSPEREERKKLTRIRKVIAARLVEAQNSSAMLTTFNEVDMTAVMELRKRFKDSFLKKHGVKLGFMSFFVKAVVSALKAVPGLNAYIDGEEYVQRNYYDISIAVSGAKGLVVPVVRNCDILNFAEIESAIGYFARKARGSGLSVDELQGGGFTITNGGIFGSLLSTPILNIPQSGILGMHKIQERAMVIDGKVEVRPMMYLALSYDHRIVDGREAVTFLVAIKDVLEDPSRLFLDL